MSHQSDDADGTLEALAQLPTIAHATVSPDGDEVALYYDGTGRNELHVLDVETGEREQWSDGEVPRNARWWIEWGDSDRVVFHLDEAGNEQNDLYAIDREGTVESVVEMDGQVVLHDVGDDGETLLFGSSRDGQMNLYRHDLGAGETTKLTAYDRAVAGATLSPDGERISYTTNETDEYDNYDVYVADADGSNARNLEVGETGAEASVADWGPAGDRLLVGDNTTDLGRCGVYDLGSDSVTWFGDLEHEETPQFFMPGGHRFLATRDRDASTVPVVYDTDTGESREFAVPDGVAGFGRGGTYVLGDDRVLLTHTSPTRRPELLVYDLATDEYEVLLAAEYGPFSPGEFADAEYLTFGSDGVPETPARAVDHDSYETLEIGALLYDPGQRQSDNRSDDDRHAPRGSPLIVNPHGGPRARDTKSFDLYTQFLVSRGYAVLQINYRGSTGRGREFVERLYGDWGGAEQGDVATGVEYVLDEYDWIDGDRVVVFGASYGGYSTYWQLAQYPELYNAGVAWIGLTDLEDLFENTMPHFRTEALVKYLGTPEENPEFYEERSPITHVGNLDAPLLMMHGVNDRRAPVSQARRYRDALQDAGFQQGEDAAFEYVELGEEGHASSDIEQKIRSFRVLGQFLDRRLVTRPGE